MRCRIGLHAYVDKWTEDNQKYRRCQRCGKDYPGNTSGPHDRFIDIGGGG